MIEFIELIKTFGNLMLQYIWFPTLVWTMVGVPIAILLHRVKSVPPVYQYHSRMVLLLSLPLGITASYFWGIIDSTSQLTEATTKLFVVQNPITVTPVTNPSVHVVFSDPIFWTGMLSTLLVGGAAYYFLKIAFSFLQLKKQEERLQFVPINHDPQIISSFPDFNYSERVLISFSEDIAVPFTYGWIQTKIVIPADLKEDRKSLAMAVQHELMHIKHRDFLLNSIMVFIKALFWMHPLTHYLHNSCREYREIMCDGEVLATNQFSRKQYAGLLLTLAQREFRSTLAMSMAVNSSTLKKRIQVMSNQTNSIAQLRSSLFVSCIAGSLIVLTIACSDMSENGITNAEFKDAQTQVQKIPTESSPLMVLNGEKLTSEEKIQKISRLKSKYIKSFEVLKGEKATSKYGKAGKNGVVEISMWEETIEKAFTDLEPKKPTIESGKKGKVGDYYVAVEKMPELIGGLRALQVEMQYPKEASEAGIEGRVIVQFIINKQGEVENPQIIKGIGGGCDAEALRVVKQARFKPGTQNGKPVRVQFSLPLTFKLSSSSG